MLQTAGKATVRLPEGAVLQYNENGRAKYPVAPDGM